MPTQRDAEIIRLRKRRKTLDYIAQNFGLTKQRVHQILEENDRKDLLGWRRPPKRIRKNCLHCNTEFGSKMYPSRARKQSYCSRACESQARLEAKQGT